MTNIISSYFGWAKRNTAPAKSLTYKDYKLVNTENGASLYVAPDEEQLLLAKKKYPDVNFVNEVAGTSTDALQDKTIKQDISEVHKTVDDLRRQVAESENGTNSEVKRHTFPLHGKSSYDVIALGEEGLNVPPNLMVGKSDHPPADFQVKTLPTRSKSKLVADWLKGYRTPQNKKDPERSGSSTSSKTKKEKDDGHEKEHKDSSSSSSSESSDSEKEETKVEAEEGEAEQARTKDEKEEPGIIGIEDTITAGEGEPKKRTLPRLFSRKANKSVEKEKSTSRDAADNDNKESKSYFTKWFPKTKDENKESTQVNTDSDEDTKTNISQRQKKLKKKKPRVTKTTSGSESDLEESSDDEKLTAKETKKGRQSKRFIPFLGRTLSGGKGPKTSESVVESAGADVTTPELDQGDPLAEVNSKKPSRNYFAKLMIKPTNKKEKVTKSDNELDIKPPKDKKFSEMFRIKKGTKSDGDLTVASESDDETKQVLRKPKKARNLKTMLKRGSVENDAQTQEPETTEKAVEKEDWKNKYKFWKQGKTEEKGTPKQSEESADSSSETNGHDDTKRSKLLAIFGSKNFSLKAKGKKSKQSTLKSENEENDDVDHTQQENMDPENVLLEETAEPDGTTKEVLIKPLNIFGKFMKKDKEPTEPGKVEPKKGFKLSLGGFGKNKQTDQNVKEETKSDLDSESELENVVVAKSAYKEAEKKQEKGNFKSNLLGLFGSKQMNGDKADSSSVGSDSDQEEKKNKSKPSGGLFNFFDRKKSGPQNLQEVSEASPEMAFNAEIDGVPKTDEDEDKVKVEWADGDPEFHYREAKASQNNQGNIMKIFGSRNSKVEDEGDDKRDERMPSDNKKHYTASLKKLWKKRDSKEEEKNEEVKEMEQKDSSLEDLAAEDPQCDDVILQEESSPDEDRKKKVGTSLKKWLAKRDGKVLPDTKQPDKMDDHENFRPSSLVVGSWGPRPKKEDGKRKTSDAEEARKSWHTLKGENYVSAPSGDDEEVKKSKGSRPVSFADPVSVDAPSDTESADHGSADKSSVSKLTSEKSSKKPKLTGFLDLLKSKSRDKVSDNEASRGMPLESDKESTPDHFLVDEEKKDGVVYAELDLGRGQTNVMRSIDDDKTEYAEIIHPDKADMKKSKDDLRKSRENLAGSREVLTETDDVTTTAEGKKEAAV